MRIFQLIPGVLPTYVSAQSEKLSNQKYAKDRKIYTAATAYRDCFVDAIGMAAT